MNLAVSNTSAISVIILIFDDFPVFFCQCEEFDDYVIKEFRIKMRKSFSCMRIIDMQDVIVKLKLW